MNSIAQTLDALKQEARIACLHLALLTITRCLPQRWHFKAFKGLARLHPLLLEKNTAVDKLLELKPELSPYRKSLSLGFAFHQLIDQADYYLTRRYGASWLDHNLVLDKQPEATWPAEELGAALFLTPHYGQGFWALRYLNECKKQPVAWLYAPAASNKKLGNFVQSIINQKRLVQIESLCSSIAIATGGSVAAMQQRLCQQKLPVLAMPDAPPVAGQSTIEVNFLGKQARLPAGVFALAERERIPVYVYTILLDRKSGKRRMSVHGPFYNLPKESLAQVFADILQDAITEDPCAWHVWPYIERFMPPSA